MSTSTTHFAQRTAHRLAAYASFVRFSHSVFALPFALAGALLAAQQRPGSDPFTVDAGVRARLWILVASCRAA